MPTTEPIAELCRPTAKDNVQRFRVTTCASNAWCALEHARRYVRQLARLGQRSNAKTRHALAANVPAVAAGASRIRIRRGSLRRRSGVRLNVFRRRSSNDRCQVAPLSCSVALRLLLLGHALPFQLLGRKHPSFYLLDPFVAGVGVLRCSVGVSGELKKKLRSLS